MRSRLAVTLSLQLVLLWGAQAQLFRQIGEGQRATNSRHIPPWIRSDLHLTPGELKLFAGHAFGIIRTQCPSVDQQKLFQLQKYIGKVIAAELSKKKEDKTEDAESTTKSTTVHKFPALVNSLTRCEKHKDEDDKSIDAQSGISIPMPNGFQTIMFQVHTGHKAGDETEKPKTGKAKSQGKKHEDSGAAKNVFLGFQDRDFQAVKKAKEHQDKKAAAATSEIPVIGLPSATKDKKEEKVKPSTEAPKASPSTNHESVKAEHRKSFFTWVSSVFNNMHSIFSKIFKNGFSRSKRSVVDSPSTTPAPEIVDFSDDGSSWSAGEAETPNAPSAAQTAKTFNDDKTQGQVAIGSLIDETCRLFCGKCSAPEQIRNFRSASKELIDYLNSDDNILIVASHILDEPFLESLRDCGRDIDLSPYSALLAYPATPDKEEAAAN